MSLPRWAARRISSTLALIVVSACVSAQPGTVIGRPYAMSSQYATGDRFMGIRLLGTLKLPALLIEGMRLAQLSGLAWDDDASVLYALSDRSHLFHLRPRFANGRLTGVEVLQAHVLRDATGRPLRGRYADAEGLAIQHERNATQGDTELIVSFERRPRIGVYRPNGAHLGDQRLPPTLANRHGYAAGNKGLESVAPHPTLGTLTAPEWPMRNAPSGQLPLYGLNGGRWIYPLARASDSALVAIEALADGSLITLERIFAPRILPLVVSVLRRTAVLSRSAPDVRLDVRTLAKLSSYDGWFVDNFEGLARHQGMRFFIVSDNNENPLQKTLLAYFEVLESEDSTAARVRYPRYRPTSGDRYNGNELITRALDHPTRRKKP